MTADLYDRAVQQLATNTLHRYEQEHHAEHLTWHDFADDAHADLSALADEGMLNIYLARQLTKFPVS